MASTAKIHRIKTAREQLLDLGVVPEGLLPESIQRSWSRCASTGLSLEVKPYISPLAQQELRELREKNSRLLQLARPEIENLQSQLCGTQNMVILTDAFGTILDTHGDADFIGKAASVALQPGVSWCEENTGTNAIGTALVERSPVFVMGPEHYISQNTFLSCAAVPILDPYGQAIGVLDVSGDYRQPLEHTMGLVRISAQMIENRLFRAEFACNIMLHFHPRPEFIGTLWEGIAVFSPEGRLLAINKSGSDQLRLDQTDIGHLAFNDLFDAPMSSSFGSAARGLSRGMPLRTRSGQQFHARVEPGIGLDTASGGTRHGKDMGPSATATLLLDHLDTGDQKVSAAVARIKKILNRDIPILIEGETGTGKELLAKAIHKATGRKGPFVAINCASIPEGLIEAELFGYEEGAFTGARRNGVSGKIMQANNGTLFLDEIGEMPLSLQARLLRVLQEREIVPLGSARGIPVDMAVISATNRKLRNCVDDSSFREDLYYRLNGLQVGLPPLRERSDMETLISRILLEESSRPVSLHKDTMSLFRRHAWRGNMRQLRNVLRAALAFMEEGNLIMVEHLPEDFVGEFYASRHEAPPAKSTTRLKDTENDLIRRALQDHAGNMSLTAADLGISRATLYRKAKRLKLI